MKLGTTLKRITKSGSTEFFRNGFVTASTILVMTITLFVIGIVMFVHAALSETLAVLKEKVDVNIYFLTTAPEEDILAMKQSIQALPEVAAIFYTSRDEAYARFKERHKDDQLILQALEEIGSNPLGASLSVRAKDTSQYDAIVKFVEEDALIAEGKESIVEKINYSQNKAAIDRLTTVINATEHAGIAFSIFLAIASILIVFNTIRLAIYTSRDEIAVMRLVGASPWYARGPFVVQGVLYGITAAILTLLLLYPIAYSLGPTSESFFGTFNMFTYYTSHFLTISGIIILCGVMLGAVSSYWAVRRYLKV
jgi:cell division transport system permease protein